jgi:hypothetical protein
MFLGKRIHSPPKPPFLICMPPRFWASGEWMLVDMGKESDFPVQSDGQKIILSQETGE